MYDDDRQSIVDSVKMFFQGDGYKGIEPVVPIPVNTFEISKFAFSQTKECIQLKVFIGNPDPFLGPLDDTVIKLSSYINMQREGKLPVQIQLFKRDVWKV